MNNPIPLVDLKASYEPLKDQIRQAWDGVLSSMHLFLGPNVQAFEREFASYCGVDHAIGVSDGTTALHLALRACQIGAGDEVITVSHTFIATVHRVVGWWPSRNGWRILTKGDGACRLDPPLPPDRLAGRVVALVRESDVRRLDGMWMRVRAWGRALLSLIVGLIVEAWDQAHGRARSEGV